MSWISNILRIILESQIIKKIINSSVQFNHLLSHGKNGVKNKKNFLFFTLCSYLRLRDIELFSVTAGKSKSVNDDS